MKSDRAAVYIKSAQMDSGQCASSFSGSLGSAISSHHVLSSHLRILSYLISSPIIHRLSNACAQPGCLRCRGYLKCTAVNDPNRYALILGRVVPQPGWYFRPGTRLSIPCEVCLQYSLGFPIDEVSARCVAELQNSIPAAGVVLLPRHTPIYPLRGVPSGSSQT